jgi:hypothetical protein
LSDDPRTWYLTDASGSHDLRNDLDRIFATFRTIPDLNR